jgi:hypothetical protein
LERGVRQPRRKSSQAGRQRATCGQLGRFWLSARSGGSLAKIADESQIRWASDLGDFPASWVLILALIAWLSPTTGRAAIWSSTFFVAMCLAYYSWASFVMGFPVARDIWLWTGLALTVVPVLGAAVRWSRDRKGPLPGLILASAGALAVVDGVIWQLWLAWTVTDFPEWFPLRPFQAIANLSVALIIAVILPRDHLTRIWAIVLLVPIAVAITAVLHDFMGILVRLIRLF